MPQVSSVSKYVTTIVITVKLGCDLLCVFVTSCEDVQVIHCTCVVTLHACMYSLACMSLLCVGMVRIV